jgi:hypothetical protein
LSGTFNARSVINPSTDRDTNAVGDSVGDSMDAVQDAVAVGVTDIAVNL